MPRIALTLRHKPLPPNPERPVFLFQFIRKDSLRTLNAAVKQPLRHRHPARAIPEIRQPHADRLFRDRLVRREQIVNEKMEAVRHQALGAQARALGKAGVGRECPTHRIRIIGLARPVRTEQPHGLPAFLSADQQVRIDDPVRHHPFAPPEPVQHLSRSAVGKCPVVGHQPAAIQHARRQDSHDQHRHRHHPDAAAGVEQDRGALCQRMLQRDFVILAFVDRDLDIHRIIEDRESAPRGGEQRNPDAGDQIGRRRNDTGLSNHSPRPEGSVEEQQQGKDGEHEAQHEGAPRATVIQRSERRKKAQRRRPQSQHKNREPQALGEHLADRLYLLAQDRDRHAQQRVICHLQTLTQHKLPRGQRMHAGQSQSCQNGRAEQPADPAPDELPLYDHGKGRHHRQGDQKQRRLGHAGTEQKTEQQQPHNALRARVDGQQMRAEHQERHVENLWLEPRGRLPERQAEADRHRRHPAREACVARGVHHGGLLAHDLENDKPDDLEHPPHRQRTGRSRHQIQPERQGQKRQTRDVSRGPHQQRMRRHLAHVQSCRPRDPCGRRPRKRIVERSRRVERQGR